MMNPEIQIIDDVLPQTYADEIENALLKDICPWFFIEDVTFSDKSNNQKSPAFTHLLLSDGKPSGYFDLTRIIPHIALEKINRPANLFQFIKARAFLQLPLSNAGRNNIHTDYPMPHTVCLYYVNDSDGDTVLFDNDQKTVIQSVTPKKNRAVIFNGLIPHCSTVPTLDKRCVINFDITL